MSDPAGFTSHVIDPPFHEAVRYRKLRPSLPLAGRAGGTSAVLAVCANGPDRAIFGSAFMVGPGIALTANHVIEQYRDIGRVPDESMVLLAPKGDELQIWGVREISMHAGADVAALLVEQRFQPRGELEVDILELTTRCPLPGELVGAMGYVAQAPRFAIDGDLRATFHLATGIAGDFYESRGQMSPGPSFASNLAIVGGMSGGPIFDAQGRVAALCGTSIPPDPDHPDYTSFGQLLWQVLVEELRPSWPIGYHVGPVKLLANADESERIREEPSGVSYRW